MRQCEIMFKLRYLFLCFVFCAGSVVLNAQNHDVRLGARVGYNAANGVFSAVSVETGHRFDCNFMVSGGVQYNTIGRTTIEARPAWVQDYDWGSLSTEVLLLYSNMSSLNNMAAGLGVDLRGRWIGGKFGYYYRIYGGRGGVINEPFNLYYEFCINALPMIDEWDLKFLATNNEMFELERHYQPTFMAECNYYPLEYLGVSLGMGCKPSGIFHVSADYYQSFLKLGVCYRW